MNYLKKWMDSGIRTPGLGSSRPNSQFVSQNAYNDLDRISGETQRYADFNFAREEADKERDYDMQMAAIRAFSGFGDEQMPRSTRRQMPQRSAPAFAMAQPGQTGGDAMLGMARNNLAQYFGGMRQPNEFGGRAM